MSSFKVRKCKKCGVKPVVEQDEDGWCEIFCEQCGREASGPTFLSAVECWNELANKED